MIQTTDLDIIIPCYNAKQTLFNTLFSLGIQREVNGFKVYLVNDNSDYDYNEEVTFFSKYFYIEEIKLDKNMGPGYARREGILNSHSKYIMFIDSDDTLYSVLSLKNLYISALWHDVCISNFILERDGIKTVKKQNTVWLHGKMYKREFLESNNINFNNYRINEDNGFNSLVFLMKPNVYYLDDITYVYKENENSITRKNNRELKIKGLEGYIYNMKWAIDEALKRDVDSSSISDLLNSVFVSMYYDYLYYINEKESSNIIKYLKELMPYYSKYNSISTDALEKFFIRKEEDLKSEQKYFNKIITFDEFVRMVDNND